MVKKPIVKKTKKPVLRITKKPILKTAKKSIVKKIKKPILKAAKKPMSKAINKPIGEISGKLVGKITHYYDQIGVAVVSLKGELKTGDKIKVGKTEFVEQVVKSMQLNHQKIEKAKKGQEIGLKVPKRVRANDLVYLV